MVPDACGHGIIIPLVTNSDGDKTVSDNYRSITLSPVISKVFESTLLIFLVNNCIQINCSLVLNQSLVVVMLF